MKSFDGDEGFDRPGHRACPPDAEGVPPDRWSGDLSQFSTNFTFGSHERRHPPPSTIFVRYIFPRGRLRAPDGSFDPLETSAISPEPRSFLTRAGDQSLELDSLL